MWRHSLLAALLLVLILPTSISAQRLAGPKRRSDTIIAAVRAVLDAQVDAWNRGDIEVTWPDIGGLNKLFLFRVTA